MADGELTVAEVMRDFKKYTSKKIVQTLYDEPESRREWMLHLFSKSCEHLKRPQTYKVWQDGYHAEEVYSNKWIKQKIEYIHQNPCVGQTGRQTWRLLVQFCKKLCVFGQWPRCRSGFYGVVGFWDLGFSGISRSKCFVGPDCTRGWKQNWAKLNPRYRGWPPITDH